MRSPLKVLWQILKLLWNYEKQLITEARASGIPCVRPTLILSVVFFCNYWGNRFDILPEAAIPGWLGKLDDIIFLTLVLLFVLLEIVNRKSVYTPTNDGIEMEVDVQAPEGDIKVPEGDKDIFGG